jgi:ATP-dependent DNA helicase RecQ
LALCFTTTRRSSCAGGLRELAGDAARGVTGMTYHALAMRLTGTSFRALSDAPRPESPSRPKWISRARSTRLIALLKGQAGADPGERDEARGPLLAGFRFILVDEYQDVDDGQYDLISALARPHPCRSQRPSSVCWAVATTIKASTASAARTSGSSGGLKRITSRDLWLTSNYRSTAAILAAAAGSSPATVAG